GSSDVCSSDLSRRADRPRRGRGGHRSGNGRSRAPARVRNTDRAGRARQAGPWTAPRTPGGLGPAPPEAAAGALPCCRCRRPARIRGNPGGDPGRHGPPQPPRPDGERCPGRDEGTAVRPVPLRPPLWLGARMRRAVGAGAAVAAGALAAGWPYWRGEPAAAAVTLACCGGFAVAGGLLAAGRSGVAAAAWAVAWAAAWNAGAGPAVSVFAQSVFFTAIGIGVLMYPGGRLEGLAARAWAGAAVVIMVGGQAVLCAFSRPAWNG